MRRPIPFLVALAAAACYSNTSTAPAPVPLPTPTGLTYEIVPSGDPANPVGIILRWDPTTDTRVVAYNVYSRSSTAASWGLRATTTSASFSDLGNPDAQYAVTATDGVSLESSLSAPVTIDPSNQLDAPLGLVPVSLDQAIQLSWQPNARAGAAASLFSYYRVYSTDYQIGTNTCTSSWVLEGTTVSEDFIASGLVNGVSRCYAVSAVSIDGHESQWSVPTYDTPRPDARNILVNAYQVTPATSGFLFYDASTQTLGEVTSGARTDIDFFVDRHGDGTLWLKPVRAGTGVQSLGAVGDLTSIDIAPLTGYGTAEVQAQIGYGYAWQMTQTDGVHYGGVRVTALGSDYVILDWSYQTAAGNPELRRVARGHVGGPGI